MASDEDVSIPSGPTPAALSRVIVPLDGGQVAERAIPVGIAVAARASLSITLVTVLSEHDLEDNARVYLDERKAGLPEVQVDLEVLRGMPVADTLLRYLAGQPGALVCCSTHARLETAKPMLGSVAEELVRRSPVPVLLVGPRVDLPEPDSAYEQIVVCVEGEASRRLGPSIRHLASALQLNRSLLQVVAPVYGAAGAKPDDRRSVLLESLSHELAGDGGDAPWEVVEDRAVPQAIASYARLRHAALLAFTSRQRSPAERYEAGSVTVAVAGTANCPLLVVGPAVVVGPVSTDR